MRQLPFRSTEEGICTSAMAARAFFVMRFRLAGFAGSPPPFVSGAARFLPLPRLPLPPWPLPDAPLPDVDTTGSGSAPHIRYLRMKSKNQKTDCDMNSPAAEYSRQSQGQTGLLYFHQDNLRVVFQRQCKLARSRGVCAGEGVLLAAQGCGFPQETHQASSACCSINNVAKE